MSNAFILGILCMGGDLAPILGDGKYFADQLTFFRTNFWWPFFSHRPYFASYYV